MFAGGDWRAESGPKDEFWLQRPKRSWKKSREMAENGGFSAAHVKARFFGGTTGIEPVTR
jgi:hypothetical protein